MRLQYSIAAIAVALSLAFQLAHGLRLFHGQAAIARKAGLVLKSSKSDLASSYAAIKGGIIAEFRSKQSSLSSSSPAAAAAASQLAPFVAEFLDDYAKYGNPACLDCYSRWIVFSVDLLLHGAQYGFSLLFYC